MMSFCAGWLLSYTSIYVAVKFYEHIKEKPGLEDNLGSSNKPGLFSFKRSNQKRTPKSPSEYNEWKREQKEPPGNPTSR